MPSIPHVLRTLRQPRAAAVALGCLVLAVVVAANQPGPASVSSAGGHAAAATRTTPAPSASPLPTETSGLRLLQQQVSFTDLSARHPGAPPVAAVAGILVDVDTRTVLWQHDMHTAHPPASTTKVVSSLVALENFAADHPVTVTSDALTQAGDETVMGLKAGEQLTVSELLQGMLLVSGNDAATTMAVDTVGMHDYVRAMNDQIAALGLHDSHFTTPVGLDDPQQYASPYDLAAVATADVEQFPLFRQIVAQTDAVLPASVFHQEYTLHNLNRLLQLYPAARGIKPGWTGDAGPCLVGMAERNGHRLIAVVMNDNQLYTDTRALLDWGFTQEGLAALLTPSPAPATAAVHPRATPTSTPRRRP